MIQKNTKKKMSCLFPFVLKWRISRARKENEDAILKAREIISKQEVNKKVLQRKIHDVEKEAIELKQTNKTSALNKMKQRIKIQKQLDVVQSNIDSLDSQIDILQLTWSQQDTIESTKTFSKLLKKSNLDKKAEEIDTLVGNVDENNENWKRFDDSMSILVSASNSVNEPINVSEEELLKELDELVPNLEQFSSSLDQKVLDQTPKNQGVQGRIIYPPKKQRQAILE